jgi:tellurite resistance protein TerC
VSLISWIVLAAAGLGCFGLDLLWSRRRSDARTAVVATVTWTLVGLAFAGAVAALTGTADAGRYLTVYVLEKTLSLDNVAVFAALLAGLAVPAARQGQTLSVGLLGALVLRVGFIAGGLVAVDALHPLLAVFGAALLVAGARMLRHQPDATAPSGPPRWTPARLRERPELLALLAIVLADVAFAADSIMAAFAVTTRAYPIVAANVFAVLGLRPLYVVLVHALDRFHRLQAGIGVLLAAIGVELVLEPWVAVPSWVTLVVVAGCLTGAVGLSLAEERGMTPLRVLRLVGVSVGGGGLLIAGVAMLVLPGPGLLVIVAGLALLAREFAWAQKPLDAGRARLARIRRRMSRHQ